MSTSIISTIVDEIIRHVRQLQPAAEYELKEGELSDCVLNIWWNLQNDDDRPHKKSRPIAVLIPGEVLKDFPNQSPSEQKTALKNIGSYISEKMRMFNPDHNIPIQQVPPTETWTVPVKGLFG